MTAAASAQRRALAVAAGYLVVLGASVWLVALAVGTPVAGADAAGWLAPVMVVAAAAGWLAVLVRLPAGGSSAARLVLPAVGAGAAFLLSGLVLSGLGSGDPLKGPLFALAQVGHPSFFLVMGLGLVASAVAGMGSPPHRGAGRRPVG